MKRATWTLILAALLTGGLGLHLVVTQPLQREIGSLRSEVTELHRGLRALADFRDDVAATNTLLSGLEQQSRRLNQVRSDLANIRQFEHQVRQQSRSAGDALAAMSDIARLQSEVIAQSQRIKEMTGTLDQLALYQRDAEQSLQNLETFHQRIVTESDGIDVAQTQFTKLIGLQKSVQQVRQQDIDRAQSRLSDLIGLRERLSDGSQQTIAALQNCEQWIALQDEILSTENRADRARKRAAQLMNLEQTLADDATDRIDAAAGNLEALLHMQKQLASQDSRLAQAVETLELMQDLQDEFHRRTQDLEGIRRGLTELVMLESLVARTVRSLQPLAELANLRRLDAGQIRSIAQSMLDQQAERVATNDSAINPPGEQQVPQPQELE